MWRPEAGIWWTDTDYSRNPTTSSLRKKIPKLVFDLVPSFVSQLRVCLIFRGFSQVLRWSVLSDHCTDFNVLVLFKHLSFKSLCPCVCGQAEHSCCLSFGKKKVVFLTNCGLLLVKWEAGLRWQVPSNKQHHYKGCTLTCLSALLEIRACVNPGDSSGHFGTRWIQNHKRGWSDYL